MINPLMNYERYQRLRALAGGEIDLYRGSGRTTAIALQALADAIRQPGREVILKDHHGSHRADDDLVRLVSTMVERLDLQALTIHTGRRTLRFGPPLR